MDINNTTFPDWCRLIEKDCKYGLVTPEGKEITPIIFDGVESSTSLKVGLKYGDVDFNISQETTEEILNTVLRMKGKSVSEVLDEEDELSLPDSCFNVGQSVGYRLSLLLDSDGDLEMIPVCNGVSVTSHWAKLRGIIPWTKRDLHCKEIYEDLKRLLHSKYPNLSKEEVIDVLLSNSHQGEQ